MASSLLTKLRRRLFGTATLSLDEEVIFFPQSGWMNQAGTHWTVPIHGWVFEREGQAWLRELAIRLLREASEIEWEVAEKSPFFQARCQMFLVDNERGKKLPFKIGKHQFNAGKSTSGGHFYSAIEIPVEDYPDGGKIEIQAVVPEGDIRVFTGNVHLVKDGGIAVISDIDDTVKITDVHNKREVVENTLFREFRPIDGMAEIYQRWEAEGASFHYVSNSPWQLFPDLYGMFEQHGFPEGDWHLNRLRIKDRSLSHFLRSAERTKPPTIAGIMEHWPQRQFILVGDSGQKDPEAYGEIARTLCGRVKHIYIRSVREEDDPESERFAEAFRDLPDTDWTLFKEASEITA